MFAAGLFVTIGATAAGIVHTAGVKRCGSPHICPVCAPKVRERRAAEIDQAVTEHIARGGLVLFVTATMRHGWGDSLPLLLDRLQIAWSRTWRFQARPGWYGGQVRAVEVTHGANGWHPHVHAAVFFPAGTELAAAHAHLRAMGTRWAQSLERMGAFADVSTARAPGWDVRTVHGVAGLARYLTKVDGGWGIGLELARSDVKRSRKGTTPFELLVAASWGDVDAGNLVLEYERATAGRRAIVSSPGLFKSLAVDELSDEDAAALAPADALVVEVVVPAEHWRQLLRKSDQLVRLLEDVAALTAGGAWTWPAFWLSVPLVT